MRHLLVWSLFSLVATAKPTALESDVLKEMNRVRANPQVLLAPLQELYRRFSGKFLFVSPTQRIETQEGAAAVTEAIRYLEKATAKPTFEYSELLSRAARDHMLEQSRTGKTGHFSDDGRGPSERAVKYLTFRGKSGENITYGDYGITGAQNVVIAFIVDDGVPDRGHRANFFDPAFQKVGISCGPHTTYQSMCVVDFAHDLKKR